MRKEACGVTQESKDSADVGITAVTCLAAVAHSVGKNIGGEKGKGEGEKGDIENGSFFYRVRGVG